MPTGHFIATILGMTSNNSQTITSSYDVVVVGAGSAGLAAAIALGRSLRSVLVIDAGHPRNAPAAHAHNLLGREGISPLDLVAAGREEARAYGVEFLDAVVDDVSGSIGQFTLQAAGRTVAARRIVLATGLTDVLPDVEGVKECWGTSVLHCPFCHGYEVRGQRIGVLATGPMVVHQALLFNQLSEHVTVFAHTVDLDDEARKQFAALAIPVVEGEVVKLTRDGKQVQGVVLADGSEHRVDAVVVGPRFEANATIFEALGGELVDHPMGRMVETDLAGKTSIPGVSAAGNISDLSAMVSASAGAGVMAGAALNGDLVMENLASRLAGA